MADCNDGWSERRETLKQVRRFLVIGVLSVLTDLAVYLLLTGLGLHIHASKGVSYVSGMVVGFLGNKFWTFESSRRSVGEPITYVVLYAITLGVNVAVNALVLGLLVSVFSPRWTKGLAFLVATGVTTVLNFLGMRFITFFKGVGQRRERVIRAGREQAQPRREDRA